MIFMARKRNRREPSSWKQLFFKITPIKAFLFALIVMSLTMFSLKSTYPTISDSLLFASALLNTILILLCYVFACAVAAVFEKVKNR
jgi:hypothetical protein